MKTTLIKLHIKQGPGPFNKTLIVMATGLGKTYLVAFFAKNFKKNLFIANREEILYQAKESFAKVMPEKKYGIYNGIYFFGARPF